MTEKQISLGIELLELEFGKMLVRKSVEAVSQFQIEVPSWLFGEFGGGRFAGYTPPGAARNIEEKLDDISIVNQITGATRFVAMHVLWDMSKDGINGSYELAQRVATLTEERGLHIGSISPTYFLQGSYRNSLASVDNETVSRYIDQTILAGEIAKELGSRLVTIWLPDGSLYPGQIDLRNAHAILKDSLNKIKKHIDESVTVLIEYKVFEPGTYSTVLPDWGSAYMFAKKLGSNFGVLVDLGHHFHSANIEQIVARLIDEEMRCGFHFNTRYVADDDHSVEPNPEVARIFYELVTGGVVVNPDPNKNWAYMIDQCSGRENRIHAILHSIDTLQQSLAKAMLVDKTVLEEYQQQDEIILANRFFNDALINADVRPIVALARQEKNLPVNSIKAYLESGYQAKIENNRK